MVRLQYDGKKRFHMTVPKQYVTLLGWKKGTEIVVYPSGEGTLIMKEMPKTKKK